MIYYSAEDIEKELPQTFIPFVVWDTPFRLYEDGSLYAWRKGNEYWYIPCFSPNKKKPGFLMPCMFQNNEKKRKGFYKNRLIYYALNPDWNIYNSKSPIPPGRMT